jgi:hypothetical protein
LFCLQRIQLEDQLPRPILCPKKEQLKLELAEAYLIDKILPRENKFFKKRTKTKAFKFLNA